MRFQLLLVAGALLLAACAAPPPEVPPTAAALPETTALADGVTEAAVAVTENPLSATIESFVVSTLPPPGTAVIVVPPDAAERPDVGFDSIVLRQSGGPANTATTLELRSDGTLVRDGATLQVSPEDVQRINALIDQIAFFDLEGQFTSINVPSEAYVYELTVNSQIANRTITMQDNLLPPELRELLSAIVALGQPAEPGVTPG